MTDPNRLTTSSVPHRRPGIPEDVAHTAVSVCMRAASRVDGAVIPVDGGVPIRHG